MRIDGIQQFEPVRPDAKERDRVAPRVHRDDVSAILAECECPLRPEVAAIPGAARIERSRGRELTVVTTVEGEHLVVCRVAQRVHRPRLERLGLRDCRDERCGDDAERQGETREGSRNVFQKRLSAESFNLPRSLPGRDRPVFIERQEDLL